MAVSFAGQFAQIEKTVVSKRELTEFGLIELVDGGATRDRFHNIEPK